MKTLSLLLLTIGLTVVPPRLAEAADAEDEIRDLLADQADAWNRGNLEAFAKPYAEDCIYVGKQVIKGRENVLAQYKKSYPTASAMGKLAFRNVEVREAGERIAIVTGEWSLEKPESAGKTIGGVFSLVFKNMDDEWRIVLDHTS
jgi:uncharacterized protein (TIGR02246 family)